MSNFDWNRYLKQHPIFSDLRDEEFAPLLNERVSIEKFVAQDQIIVKEGDQDQSIYLIGQGSANVFLKGPNDQDISLNSMGKGDLIGEMALFEHKKRSATVIAAEPCILLEFNGPEFIKLLHKHPEIGFKLLVKLSERLRDLGDNVLNEKLRSVDEKIKHVNAKLDTEIKIIDASLKATQTVFDQTSKRAHEIIESAERSRSRFTVAATALTIIFSILSLFGINEVWSLNSIQKEVEILSKNSKEEMENYRLKVKGLTETAKAHKKVIENEKNIINQVVSKQDAMPVIWKLDASNRQIKKFFKKSLVWQFNTEMNLDTEKTNTYEFALSLKDDDISDAIYDQIVKEILKGPPDTWRKDTWRKCAEILRSGIDDPNNTLSERQKTLSFYLLLAIFILNEDDSQYREYFEKFEGALEDIHDPGKETAELNFGVSVFKKFINNDTKSTKEIRQAKIDKINFIWGLIPKGL